MTYWNFLALFLGVPLAGFALAAWLRGRTGSWIKSQAGRTAVLALLVHVGVAVAYTTPWDNYLVATGVWWYDPARVLGITLGWVPLEEYFFFVLQTLLTGILLLGLAGWAPPAGEFVPDRKLRFGATLAVAGLWLFSAAILALGWQPGTYLGLELVWALPPIALQVAVGADILWRRRRSVLGALAISTLYLAAADFLAIGIGVWTIDPAQSLNVFIGGVLPVEEFVFFLLTNTLVTFGLTLAVAPETWARLRSMLVRPALTRENAP